MKDKMIILYWENISLATLSKQEEKYNFNVNYYNIKKAISEGCPTIILGINSGLFEKIPSIFHEFDISSGRTDIFDKLNIKPTDSKFDILYKRAQNSNLFFKKSFWIDINRD